jgi:hypothetical protein
MKKRTKIILGSLWILGTLVTNEIYYETKINALEKERYKVEDKLWKKAYVKEHGLPPGECGISKHDFETREYRIFNAIIKSSRIIERDLNKRYYIRKHFPNDTTLSRLESKIKHYEKRTIF